MPLIKSAIKKVRVDERRRAINLVRQSRLRTLIKKARAEASFEAVSAAYAALDKAVKVNMVHRNYADRQKAQLSKLAKPTKIESVSKVVSKTVAKKASAKASVKPAAKVTTKATTARATAAKTSSNSKKS